MFIEGDFVDIVIGIFGFCSYIVMLWLFGGGLGLELSSFVLFEYELGFFIVMVNELGLCNVVFEVDDL